MFGKDVLPPVSVAMATYNGERYLEEQLDSILSQTLPPMEIVVCDDSSSDNTVSILEKYSKKFNVRYVVNESQLGLTANFKKAVSLVAGSGYIALSDQDDIWLPRKLELSALKLKNIDDNIHPSLVYSDLIFVDKTGAVLNQSFRNELGQDGYVHCLKTLLFGNFVNGCTVLMNQKMKVLFDTIPDHVELNHDAWITLIAFTFGKVDVVQESLMKYRKHDSNAAVLTTLRKMNRYDKIRSELASIWKPQPSYLFEQLILVQKFYDTFESSFSVDDRRLIERFLSLKNRSYLEKKILLRWFFKGQWISSKSRI